MQRVSPAVGPGGKVRRIVVARVEAVVQDEVAVRLHVGEERAALADADDVLRARLQEAVDELAGVRRHPGASCATGWLLRDHKRGDSLREDLTATGPAASVRGRLAERPAPAPTSPARTGSPAADGKAAAPPPSTPRRARPAG